MADNKMGIDNNKKYTNTMAKAGVGAPVGVGEEMVILTEEEMSMISRPTPEKMREILRRKDLEFAPKNWKMKEGDVLEGILEGNGPQASFTNPDTGKETIVNTWILKHPKAGVRLSLLSSVQLDKKLPPFIGGEVIIVRGPDDNIGNGRRMTNYEVGGPYREDGTKRSWSIVVDQKVLDVPGYQDLLPAGSMEDAA